MRKSGLADSPLFLIDSPEPESVRQPPVSASDLGEKDSVDSFNCTNSGGYIIKRFT